EDRAELRLVDRDGRLAGRGRARADRGDRDDGDRGDQGEEEGSCPHAGPPGEVGDVLPEDARGRRRSVGGMLRSGCTTENDEGRPWRAALRTRTAAVAGATWARRPRRPPRSRT